MESGNLIDVKAFLVEGTLSGVSLGQSDHEVAAILGRPSDWRGRAGFTKRIPRLEDSPIWFYQNGAFGMVFDKDRRVISLVLGIEKLRGVSGLPVCPDGFFDFTDQQIMHWLDREGLVRGKPARQPAAALMIAQRRCVFVQNPLRENQAASISALVMFSDPLSAEQFACTGEWALSDSNE